MHCRWWRVAVPSATQWWSASRAQGSQHDNVCLHVSRFKPGRNNIYTGCTRPTQKLAIRGVKSITDFRAKCELHPESVLMEHALTGAFSEARVARAREERRQQLAASADGGG